jgi:beta-N-acetylhexosaminidase|tara:strand:+ start:344 stop:1417 length:1074 start_codon:yes stop_codon:yes gene_type:complete
MKHKKIILLIFLTIIIIFIGIFYFNTYKPNKEISNLDLSNIEIKNNTINLESLTIKQKIGQMIMIRGDEEDLKYNKLNVGGIFLDRQQNEEEYRSLIFDYQSNSKIRLLVSTDMEGAWTPFHNPEPHQKFPHFSNINTSEEAEEIGVKHGELLKDIGFNINFAPVSEYYDDVYGGRTFSGSDEEISQKVGAYIRGLQLNVLGTCKHYPGNSMEKNLHDVSDEQVISERDLHLFNICLENNVSSIMVSHQIATGVLDSQGKPSTVSEEIISTVDEDVLVIADEINMRGLKDFYPDKTELYIDLINSGENLILDFYLDSIELYKLIEEIEAEVENGNIDEQKIDYSVKKILEIKGYGVF